MPSFTTLPNASVQAGGRPRGSTITALRDNPLAVAEGFNAGAPIVAAGWHPYNRTVVGGSQTGLIYDFAVTGAVPNVVTPDFVDGYEYRVRFRDVSQANVGALNFRMDIYLETDLIYGTAFTLIPTVAASDLVSGEVEMLDVRRSERVQMSKYTAVATTTTGGATGVVNTFFCIRTAQKRLNARFYWSAGNIDAGKFFLDKRTAHY